MVPIDRSKNSTQHVCHMPFSLVCSRDNQKNTDMVIFSICPGVTFQSNKIKNFISLTLLRFTPVFYFILGYKLILITWTWHYVVP